MEGREKILVINNLLVRPKTKQTESSEKLEFRASGGFGPRGKLLCNS